MDEYFEFDDLTADDSLADLEEELFSKDMVELTNKDECIKCKEFISTREDIKELESQKIASRYVEEVKKLPTKGYGQVMLKWFIGLIGSNILSTKPGFVPKEPHILSTVSQLIE